ncbi:MAG: hypothetical protein WC675_04270 [Patescibacteria group bacterium]|jgi:cytochrome bd-type quinol oxidase subunit 2
MKKHLRLISSFLIISFLVLVFLPNTASAESIFQKMLGGYKTAVNKAYGGETGAKTNIGTFSGGLFIIVNYLLTLVGIAFFLLLIYAGYLWMTARGNEEHVERAKKITREAVIALLIILLARIFTELVIYYIGSAATSTPTP